MSSDEEERVRTFVKRHEPFVRAVAARRVADDDVDDVVQAVFIGAWRKGVAVECDPSPRAHRVWLYRATINEALTRHRSHGRRQRLIDRIRRHSGLGDAVGPDSEWETRNHELSAALERLSPGDRQLLCAAFWDGLSSDELALLVRCKPAAARKRLSRAVERLRSAYTTEVER